MRLRDVPGYARDTLLRMFPHRAPTGLVRIGAPGRDAPVLLTGNFTLTVRRLRQALAGRDAWLLCADSRGINVWCAAGGGELTHHDVIAVLRTSGIEAAVDHREVVLPQLCATGVERRLVSDATGWSTRWGPASLEDLPAFLDGHRRPTRAQRTVRFPLRERLEMATVWGVPMAVVVAPVVGWIWGLRTLFAAGAALACVVVGMFALVPWLRVEGRGRWLTHAAAAGAGAAAALLVLAGLDAVTTAHVVVCAATACVAAGLLAVDLAGTTPLHASTVNTFHDDPSIELVEERCTGAAECVQVCPRDVLAMDGARRKVAIVRPGQCIRCGACIVQCPKDALRFRLGGDRVVEAPTIRSTRMNLLGRRTVHVQAEQEEPPATR